MTTKRNIFLLDEKLSKQAKSDLDTILDVEGEVDNMASYMSDPLFKDMADKILSAIDDDDNVDSESAFQNVPVPVTSNPKPNEIAEALIGTGAATTLDEFKAEGLAKAKQRRPIIRATPIVSTTTTSSAATLKPIRNPIRTFSTFGVGDVIGKWLILSVLSPGQEGEAYCVALLNGDKTNQTEYILKLAYNMNLADRDEYQHLNQLENEAAIYAHLSKNITNKEYAERFPRMLTMGVTKIIYNINPNEDVVNTKNYKTLTNNANPLSLKQLLKDHVYGHNLKNSTVTIGYFVMTKFTTSNVYTYMRKITPKQTDVNGNIVCNNVNQPWAKKLAFGYLELLQILHSAGVVHLDCHASNVFMGDFVPGGDPNSIFKLKLIDFGRAKIVKTTYPLVYTESETEFFKAVFITKLEPKNQLFAHNYQQLQEKTFSIPAVEMYYFDYTFAFYVIFGFRWSSTSEYKSIFFDQHAKSQAQTKSNIDLHSYMYEHIKRSFRDGLFKIPKTQQKANGKDADIVMKKVLYNLFSEIRVVDDPLWTSTISFDDIEVKS